MHSAERRERLPDLAEKALQCGDDVGDMRSLMADRSPLILRFANLAGNSLKYSDRQTPDIQGRAVRGPGGVAHQHGRARPPPACQPKHSDPNRPTPILGDLKDLFLSSNPLDTHDLIA